jgi:hypothetical protein
MPQSMSMSDQSERWRVPLLVVLIALLAGYLVAHRSRHHEVSLQEGWKLTFDAGRWKLGQNEMREIYKSPAGVEVYRNRAVWVGPLLLSRSFILNPSILGTNAIRAGMVLYDPVSGKEIGQVVSVESSHEFPDGTFREGALLRVSGGESWVPRANLNKALTGM